MAKIDVWVRAGVTISADKKKFSDDPENALIEAIKRGNYRIDGEVYIPDEDIEFNV